MVLDTLDEEKPFCCQKTLYDFRMRLQHTGLDQRLIVYVVVTAASVGDREGLKILLQRWFIVGVHRIRKLWVDAGYQGSALKRWVADLKRTHKIDLEVTDHDGRGFQVVPKRWVVERTFSWLFKFRRPSKDYEVLTRNSEAMIQSAMCSV